MLDAHQHFWNYNPERDTWITPDMAIIRNDFYPLEAEILFKDCGINGCVAVQADSSEEETLFLLSLAEQFDFVKAVVGWVDLQDDSIYEKLDYFSQFEDLKGFRHIVQGESDQNFFERERFLRGIKALKAFNYTYDILILPHQIESALKFAKKIDSQSLILDHLGKPPIKSGNWKEWEKWFIQFKDLKHLSAKISGILTEADWKNWKKSDIITILEIAIETFGPNRLLFGSDYPVLKLAADLPHWVELVNSSISQLSRSEQDQILFKNCQEFYHLD
ncbi:MAG: hypothetical protein RIR51_792 [Bacteroidota bacterium]